MGITTTDAIQVASKNPLEFGARQHSQITVISGIPSLGTYVANYLARNGDLLEAALVNPHSVDSTTLVPAETVVYIPSLQDRNTVPDLSEAKRILSHYRDSGATLCILVSSAAIYDANIRNSGLVPESHPLPTGIRPIANQWMKLEEIAEVTATTLGTVKSRLTRGREALRQRLTAYVEATGAGMGLRVSKSPGRVQHCGTAEAEKAQVTR